ncbi:hypothetical protein BDV3_004909 [Batrachochytrium dendrobatidis]|nr:swr complex subunit [Batrachochytrium dendrobatidis]KAK5670921.1 swr complex subunit [Batrachochytrium dendrobatidis]
MDLPVDSTSGVLSMTQTVGSNFKGSRSNQSALDSLTNNTASLGRSNTTGSLHADIASTQDNPIEFILPTLQLINSSEQTGSDIKGSQYVHDYSESTINANILAITGGIPPLIQSRKVSTTNRNPAKRWQWQPFTHSARLDNFKLYHWSSDPKATDSMFASQSVKASIMTYTDEEYESYLQDPSWTREETDQLFLLCKEFELRFFVIADRFETNTVRTIEDMKDRYYSVSRTLVLVRYGAQDAQAKLMSAKFGYDKPREVERKRLLAKLLSRTSAQIQEEEIIMLELKRRALNEDRWVKDREAILRSLMNNELPNEQIASTPHSVSSVEIKKKRRSVRGDETPISSTADAFKNSRKDRTIDDSLLRKEKIPAGVHLRSSRFPPIKASLQAKVSTMMIECGAGILPSMPTTAVCAKFEAIRQTIVALIEGKKMLDRLEHEYKVTLIRRTTLKDGIEGGVKPAPSITAVTSAVNHGTALHATLAAQTPVSTQKRPSMTPPSQLRDTKRPRH